MARNAVAWLVGSALASAACGRSAPELGQLPETGGAAATAGDSSGIGGTAGTTGLGGSIATGGTGGDLAGTSNDPCESQPPLAGQRIVRLSFDQIAAALGQLFGTEVASDIAARHELPALEDRTFPPLQNAREGSLVTDSVFQLGDAVAQAAARYVLENFAVVTGCGSSPTDVCAGGFVRGFAERAYRRPLTDEEGANLASVYSSAKSFGGTIEQATQHGVYAALVSPHFVYRTELGDGSGGTNASLTAFEVASLLSFFLTNGPPDGELLDAASAATLLREEVLENQTARLLALPETRRNLETALLSYLGIYALPSLAIDPSLVDTSTLGIGMRNSMVHEAELFLGDHLWDGSTTSELLASRRSRVNSTLALAYGPEIQATVDPNPDVFAEVTLPAERAGLLTMPGFLTAHVRPEASAVTGRGLLVNALITCQPNPPEHPPSIDAPYGDPRLSQRENADLRAAEATCAGCHSTFDGYGLALERFDSIGRYRTADAEGRFIDETVSIPLATGSVSGATGLADVLSQPQVWGACLAETLLRFALAEPTASRDGTSCAAAEAAGAHANGDASFPTLVREIVRSRALAVRTRGEF